MFDRELFEKICNQYNVSFSSEYQKPMIRCGDTVRPLSVEQDFELLTAMMDETIQSVKKDRNIANKVLFSTGFYDEHGQLKLPTN